ncbi:MAG: FtsX-like permease family protein, partial [Oscillospiraceae bacterium]|nr:FtsX-like permease family protein [Oscillospiraceae bacterium]
YIYYQNKNETGTVQTHSLPDNLNKIDIAEGRLPQNENECAVERELLQYGKYKIGDTITLGLDNMDDYHNVLNSSTFTIVGIVSSPLYINAHEHGNTALGDGRVDYFVYLSPEAYKLDVYTDAYILMDGSHDIDNLTTDYYDNADEWEKQIETTGDIRVQAKKDDFADQQTQIDENRASIDDAQKQIDDSRKLLQDNLSQLESLAPQGVSPELDVQYEQIQNSLNQLDEKQSEIDKNLSDLNSAQEKLSSAPTPEWFYFTRKDGLSYDSYYQDSLRIQKVGYVFPMVFLLVAVLVSLTTMSRMVEEQRTQIGIYKALGYKPVKIVMKYIIYAFIAGVIGGIVGVIAGSNIFPRVIGNAYGHLYNMPHLDTPVPMAISLIAISSALGAVLLVTLITCIGAMRGAPAELMRPKSPPAGKRVLIERIPFVWNRLKFISKVTARNIFRYKKRFIMTLVGVAGCSALLVTAFGLRDSIGGVVGMQYDKVAKYNSQAYLKDITTIGLRTELDSLLAEIPGDYVYIRQETINSAEFSAYLIVPENPGKLGDFINLRSRATGEAVPLINSRGEFDDGVLLTEKLARETGVSVGGSFSMTASDEKVYTVKVTGIVENYVLNYVYMAPDIYRNLFGSDPVFNSILAVSGDTQAFASELLADNDVRAVVNTSDLKKNISHSTDALQVVTIVLIVLACALAFVVLFNLTNINISERVRELATIKVLGFYDSELAMYIYRENILVTAMGIILGIIGGIFLHMFVLNAVEIDLLMFPEIINPQSYIYSVLLTAVFAVFVNLVMNFKLASINMVESLKNVE